MLLSTFIRESTQALSALYPSPEARGMVLMLCEERLGVRSWTHIVEPEKEIPEEALAGLGADMEALLHWTPIQYVLGFADFYGLRFTVDPSVLIPRPETELLVKEAVTAGLSLGRAPRVLDLCTGSGCIAWSVQKEIPDAEVVALDISGSALALARNQFAGDSPLFLKADVLDTGQDFPHGPFDLILSNPPYVMEKEKAEMRRNVLDHEPALALFVADDDPLLFYRAVARWAERFLAPGGTGIVEINEALGEETAEVFRASGFRDVSIIRDLSGRFRMVRFSA